MSHRFPRLLVLSFVALSFGAGASAQSTDTAPDAPVQMVSANPFTLMFGSFNADYERRFTPNLTWGVAGSFFSIGDFGYKNASASLRYYPRAALSGFYIGGSSGVHHLSALALGANFYGAGFDLGYNWLLGRKRPVTVGLGAGVTRIFGGNLAGASFTVPTLRLLNVGVAF